MKIKNICVLMAIFALLGCSTKKTKIVEVVEFNIHAEEMVATVYEDFRRNAGNKVYFAFDKVELSEEAKNTLKKQAAWLLAHRSTLAVIEGHCDPIGTREYNFILALKRAEAVKKFLVAEGVTKERLSVISCGKDNPEVPGSIKEAELLNRRVVTIIIK